MKVRNFLKWFLPTVSVVVLTSCSNSTDSLTGHSGTKTTAVTTIPGLQIRDMGWAGGQLWAVSKTAQGSNYRLATYVNGRWQTTAYAGLRCAVSNSGKCYYVNSSNQIWWVKRNSNGTFTNQQITTLPVNRVPKDIGAGTFDGNDRLWVRFKDNLGNYTIQWADYSGSGNSVVGGAAGWREPVPVIGGSPQCVSADPYVAVVGVTISSNNCFNWCNPEPHGHTIPDLNCNLVDVATCDGKFLIVTDNQTLYRGDGLTSWEAVSRFANYNVAMTKINGIIYALYINSGSYLEFVKFDDLHD